MLLSHANLKKKPNNSWKSCHFVHSLIQDESIWLGKMNINWNGMRGLFVYFNWWSGNWMHRTCLVCGMLVILKGRMLLAEREDWDYTLHIYSHWRCKCGSIAQITIPKVEGSMRGTALSHNIKCNWIFIPSLKGLDCVNVCLKDLFYDKYLRSHFMCWFLVLAACDELGTSQLIYIM